MQVKPAGSFVGYGLSIKGGGASEYLVIVSRDRAHQILPRLRNIITQSPILLIKTRILVTSLSLEG